MEEKKVDYNLSNLTLTELIETYEETKKFLSFLDDKLIKEESSEKNE